MVPALIRHRLRHLARSACVLAGVLLAACGSAPRSGPPERLALVIGNAAYDNVTRLVNPTNDAADMCAELMKLRFKVLCHTNVRDRAEFDARVQDYANQLGPSTVGVFYYSGHGVQAGNANYLIPTRVQLKSATEDPTRVLYNVDELFDRLRRKPPRFQLIVLDACRADLFASTPRPNTRVAATANDTDSTRSTLVRALETVSRASNGLQPIKDAPPGTIVLYATASRDLAFDGDGRNGPLTKHVLEHIGTRGIFFEEFIKRVTSGVEQDTFKRFRKRQTPFIYGSFSGRFCFASCPGDDDRPLPAVY